MYFLFPTQRFSIKNFRKYPFRWIIRWASQSKFHHSCHTIKKAHGIFISEGKYPIYRNIALNNWLDENPNTDVHAYKVIKKIDPIIQRDFERDMLGRKYDTKGAIYSEVHKIPILRKIFKTDPNDDKQFCSESDIELCVRQGFIPEVRNENFFSPQELLEILLDKKVVNPKPEIWRAHAKMQ